MRRFLTGLLATLGGITLAVLLGAGLAFWLLLPEKPSLPARTVLALDLRGSFDEEPAGGPLSGFGLGRPSLTLPEAVLAIERAAADDRVQGMVARLNGDGQGIAQTQELRVAITRFRESGKFALAHATSFGEFGPGTLSYYLASAFDEVHLQPLGSLGLTGLYIETPLLRDFFEKVGVKPSGDRRGPYKSAADMFTENTLTEAHRESLEWLADSLDEQLREGLATARGIERDRIGDLIDGGPYAADEALEAKLVDRLSYQDEVIEQAHDLAGEGAEMVGLEAYAAAAGPSGEPAATIALIRGVGQIQEGESDRGPGGWVMGGDSTAKALADAIDDPEVEAILFRIDSGGGSAVASETIGRQVRRARDTGKPVIVSMGNAAASGGYWIAMDAASIVADPGTLTGSIGVLAGKPVLTELWHWLGVNWGHVQRGANADIWSTTQDFDAAGRERLENFLDRTYDAFTAGVARGRGMSQAEVEAIAEGRVWTGAQAKELGLVDELGGFSRALQIARETAGVGPEEPIELRPFPRPRGPLEEALDLLGDPPLIGAETRFGWDRIRGWLDAVQPGILRMPPIIVR